MSNGFRRFDWSVVSPEKSRLLPGPAIWLIKSVAESASVELALFDACRVISVDQDRSALIASATGVKMTSRAGAWKFQKIPLFEAAKLLAFLECCTNAAALRGNGGGDIVLDAPSDLNIWKFEGWLIERVMQGDPSAGGMFDFFGSQGSDGLVRVL